MAFSASSIASAERRVMFPCQRQPSGVRRDLFFSPRRVYNILIDAATPCGGAYKKALPLSKYYTHWRFTRLFPAPPGAAFFRRGELSHVWDSAACMLETVRNSTRPVFGRNGFSARAVLALIGFWLLIVFLFHNV